MELTFLNLFNKEAGARIMLALGAVTLLVVLVIVF